jgi:hypothetical protein
VGLFSLPGEDRDRQAPPASQNVPASATTTTHVALSPAPNFTSTSSRVTDPAGASTTSSTEALSPPPGEPSSTTAGTAEEQVPPGIQPLSGDAASRLAQAGAQAGYKVLHLQEPGWELMAVDLGVFDDETYVDSVYRRGGDYLNLAQSPVLDQPSLPNAVQLNVRGQAAQVLEMGGGIILVQWDENGSRVRVTSDLARESLVSLLEALQEVGANP